ncbi:MAG: hypothetical protein KatS3mg011_1995 [Acidimicrobiia bacterium]|nr:MAG: hypothetical protein KatS3mg011_1995 [Acidimicrobiia bacterium]
MAEPREARSYRLGFGITAWKIGLVGTFIGSILVIRTLVAYSWDPTIFLAFGEEADETLSYGRALLHEVDPRPALGHDGKFFFALANDPFLLDPEDHAAVLDRPTYRAQRMLYPTLAGGFGLFPPRWVMWGMIVVNVLALGAGTWVTARYVEAMGGSPWWGLSFALNPGVLSEVTISGAGVLALALALAGVWLLRRNSWVGATTAFTLAVLSREVYLLAVLGAGLWLWKRDRRRSVLMTGIPLVAAGLWAAYVRWRLADLPTSSPTIQEIGWPLQGIVQAFGGWLRDPFDLTVGLVVAVVAALTIIRTVRMPTLLDLTTVGFAVMVFFLTRQVWQSYFDISRAIAPVLTSWVLSALRHTQATLPSANPLIDWPRCRRSRSTPTSPRPGTSPRRSPRWPKG